MSVRIYKTSGLNKMCLPKKLICLCIQQYKELYGTKHKVPTNPQWYIIKKSETICNDLDVKVKLWAVSHNDSIFKWSKPWPSQNESSPGVVAFQSDGLNPTPVRQIHWTWKTCWHLPVLFLFCSLSHFLLLYISFLTLIRGTVILRRSFRFKHSFKRFPPVSLSLTHTYKIRFPFAQNCTFFRSHTFYASSKELGSYSKLKMCLSDLLPWADTCLPSRPQPSVLAHKHTNTAQIYTQK